MRVVVGITGASGAIYAVRLLGNLKKRGIEIMIIPSSTGLEMASMEMGLDRQDLSAYGPILNDHDLKALTASGSYHFDAMVIVPCSMKTLACIANGIASSLIARTAEVALKERRKLVLVTRETPLSLIDIKNMESVTCAGGIVLPASPGFYHSPKSVEELADHIVGKILDQLSVENNLFKRWGSN